jgi:predicted O-methyltransferase YrrM
MTSRTIAMDDRVYAYFRAQSLRESEVLRRLREETQKLPYAIMQIAPEQGQFMAFLVELMGAKRAVEIGTFTGYSALCVAKAMGAEGRLVACDVSEEWTSIARKYWAEAGVAERIELRLAPALETLKALAGERQQFDFAFIDADKRQYEAYYEGILALLRPGGVIAVDNVLWDGKVADAGVKDADTMAIRAFNARVLADQRVSLTMVPIGDGLILARKRT